MYRTCIQMVMKLQHTLFRKVLVSNFLAYGGVNIEDIRGMRAPFLAIGGNNMFSMLYDANCTHDSSSESQKGSKPSPAHAWLAFHKVKWRFS